MRIRKRLLKNILPKKLLKDENELYIEEFKEGIKNG